MNRIRNLSLWKFVFVLAITVTGSNSYHQKPMGQFVASGSTADLNQESNSSSNPELKQLITFFRHGTATAEGKLYDGEWEAYKIEGPNDGEGLLTALGFGQCWSAGVNLAGMFPSMAEELTRDGAAYEINIGPKTKSRLCSQYIWEGIQGRTPFIGLFEEALVAEAFRQHGNCESCPEATAFPFEYSQTLTEESKPKTQLSFVKHSSEFIDLDDTCYDIKKLSFKEVESISEDDLRYIRGLSPDNAEFSSINAMRSVGKHIYHNLPALDISKEFYEQALLAIRQEPQEILAYFAHEHRFKWAFQAIFARNLLKDLSFKVGDFDQRWVAYLIHDNNFLALLVFLLGYENDMLEYQYGYASSLHLAIYEDPSSGEQFVRLIKDGQQMTMADCASDCPLQQFEALVEEYSELGGDLEEVCQVASET